MARVWKPCDFDSLYDRFICTEQFQVGGRKYHQRYRSRYKTCVKRFAALAPNHPIDVLDIGGGQLALLCKEMWNDRAVASDLPLPHLNYIAENGVKVIHWDLCASDAPLTGGFDFVFMSEVIEHLPIPGHVVLERIRKAMRPNGILLCTTPNLYRLRNVLFMATGRPIFDHFQMGDGQNALGHILEYTAEHLAWQFLKAGFENCTIERVQMSHMPTNRLHRPLAILGYPLHLIPLWRDNLVATARVPLGASAESIAKE
jgi:SAM-dependent methyltransferase